jgi:glutathione synthase/RimK-type ligase-like ATP-grasp enzyme
LLLIAGGLLDPNLQALADTAEKLGIDWMDWRFPKDASPPCHWELDLDTCPPWGPGPMPTGAFMRQDVFFSLEDPRPEVAQRSLGWFTAVQGWLLSNPGVRTFNADISALALNKPAALLRARHAGLTIPRTWVSNDTAKMRAQLSRQPSIAKPVAGGGYCQTLEEALADVKVDHAAMPALIQPRLAAAEMRVFVIGDDAHAFSVSSPSLDYRALQDAEVESVPVPPQAAALRRLMAEFRMSFGAADLKTDPDTGELVFLELNTSPMFARFDQACDGALTTSMIRHLLA